MQPATALPAVPPTIAATATTSTDDNAFDLRMGARLPVPVLMRPSPNPMSAGTYPLGRQYSVGDEAVYAESSAVGFGGEPRLVKVRVTRVEEDVDRVVINEGAFEWDTMGNPFKLGPLALVQRVQQVPAELQLGRRWTTRFRYSESGFGVWSVYYNYVVVSREDVRVPAGEFEAFRLEGSGFGTNGRFTSRLLNRHWVVPGFNFAVKEESTSYIAIVGRMGVGEVRELVSCQQRHWIQT